MTACDLLPAVLGKSPSKLVIFLRSSITEPTVLILLEKYKKK